MELSVKLRKTLQDNGHSITRARLKTFEALVAAHQPLTVVELAERLVSVDKVSVYRSIHLFESIGVIHKVWTGFKSKVELSEVFSAHHHHFSCILCGHTENITSLALENNLHSIEAEYGFELIQHSVELSGYCMKCSSKNLRS